MTWCVRQLVLTVCGVWCVRCVASCTMTLFAVLCAVIDCDVLGAVIGCDVLCEFGSTRVVIYATTCFYCEVLA